MKVLELFSGTKSFSKIAEQRGHETFTVDINSDSNPDLCKDVMELTIADLPYTPQIVWSSNPCQFLSIANCKISDHWNKVGDRFKPISEEAEHTIELLNKTLDLIEDLKPDYYFIENPRGMMRKIDPTKNLPHETVWYCRYQQHLPVEERTPKPTDIFTNLIRWSGRSCHRGNKACHGNHPRGSRHMVDKDLVDRYRVPKKLCEEILMVIEDPRYLQPSIMGGWG